MSTPSLKTQTSMESSLTQSEMDAVVQLIQLSGGDSGDFKAFWLRFAVEKEENHREESVGETTSSSSVINPEKSQEEALPRRRKRFMPIADIYRKTRPLIDNRSPKRSKI